MRLHLQGQSWTNDVLRGSRGLRPRLQGQWPDGVLFVAVDVDYVVIDDVNYDRTTRLNHTVLADQMTPVRIIGSTLSKKNSKLLFLYFTISFVYLLQIALQIAGSSFAEGFSERRLIAESSSHGSLSRRERGCHHSQYTNACKLDLSFKNIFNADGVRNLLEFQSEAKIFVRNQCCKRLLFIKVNTNVKLKKNRFV